MNESASNPTTNNVDVVEADERPQTTDAAVVRSTEPSNGSQPKKELSSAGGQAADLFPATTLALGGGGSRGVSHLGVLEVLTEAGCTVERILGVSIGSLAGSMYAFHPHAYDVQKQALDYLLSPAFQRHQEILFGARPSSDADEETGGGLFSWYDRVKSYLRANRLFHRVVSGPSLLPGVILQDVVDFLLPEADIADAVVPLSIVAVDLRSGRKVVLDKGPVREAVKASSALPGIFPPVELNGMLLCDVGVFYSVPTVEAQAHNPSHVTAVDVGSGLKPLTEFETALDVMMRMDEIGEFLFRDDVLESADFVIRPQVGGVEWFDFSRSEDLVEAGRTAAREAVAAWEEASAYWKVQSPLFRRVGRWLGRM